MPSSSSSMSSRRGAAVALLLLALSTHALTPLEAAYAPELLRGEALPVAARRAAVEAQRERDEAERDRSPASAAARQLRKQFPALVEAAEGTQIAVIDDLLLAAFVASIVFTVVTIFNAVREKVRLKQMRQTIDGLFAGFKQRTARLLDALQVVAEEVDKVLRAFEQLLTEGHAELAEGVGSLISEQELEELVGELGSVSPEELLHGKPAEKAKNFLVKYFRKAKGLFQKSPAAFAGKQVATTAGKSVAASFVMPTVQKGIVWTLGAVGVGVTVATVGAVLTFASTALSAVSAIKSFYSLENTKMTANMQESVVRVYLNTKSMELEAAACPVLAQMYEVVPDEKTETFVEGLYHASNKAGAQGTAPNELLKSTATRIQLLQQGVQATWGSSCAATAKRSRQDTGVAKHPRGEDIVSLVVGGAGDADALKGHPSCAYEQVADAEGRAELNNEHKTFSRHHTVSPAPSRKVDGEFGGKRRPQSRALYVCRRRGLHAGADKASALTDVTMAWGQRTKKEAKKNAKKGAPANAKTVGDARNNRLTVEDLLGIGYSRPKRFDAARPELQRLYETPRVTLNEKGQAIGENDMVLMSTACLANAGRINGIFLARGAEATPDPDLCTVSKADGYALPTESSCPWRRVGGVLPTNYEAGSKPRSADAFLWERRDLEVPCPHGTEKTWCFAK